MYKWVNYGKLTRVIHDNSNCRRSRNRRQRLLLADLGTVVQGRTQRGLNKRATSRREPSGWPSPVLLGSTNMPPKLILGNGHMFIMFLVPSHDLVIFGHIFLIVPPSSAISWWFSPLFHEQITAPAAPQHGAPDSPTAEGARPWRRLSAGEIGGFHQGFHQGTWQFSYPLVN